MNTIENNKLIANFMNHKDIDLNYHSDWNLIMTVIEKIESLQATIRVTSNFNHFRNQNYHQVTIEIADGKVNSSNTCFSSNGFLYKHHSNSSLNKINCYYESIVEFIKWYNTNN